MLTTCRISEAINAGSYKKDQRKSQHSLQMNAKKCYFYPFNLSSSIETVDLSVFEEVLFFYVDG